MLEVFTNEISIILFKEISTPPQKKLLKLNFLHW